MDINWRMIPNPYSRTGEVEYKCNIGKVEINYTDISHKLRYVVAGRATYGQATSWEKAKKEVEALAPKLATVKTMNQLMAVVDNYDPTVTNINMEEKVTVQAILDKPATASIFKKDIPEVIPPTTEEKTETPSRRRGSRRGAY